MLGILSLPALAIEPDVQPNQELNKNNAIETVAENSNEVQQTSGSDAETSQESAVQEQPSSDSIATTYKQPVSKKKIAKKFILAMLGVLVSSLIIFVGLSLYNKIRESFFAPSIKSDNKKEVLEDPLDLNEAVKSFLNKTHWGE